jgi:glycosyltransferase involved in cell wall biosynthesis
MKNKNLLQPLMVGPILAISGQGEAFRQSCKAIPQSIVVDAEFSSTVLLVTYPLRLLIGFIRTKKVIYFTSSRSVKGFYSRDFWIFLFALLFQRKLINHLHGIDFEKFRKKSNFITQYLIDFFYNKIEVSIAPAEFVLNQYHRYSKMQLKTVENFFDVNMTVDRQHKKSSDTLEIIYLSNLISTKGFVVLVDACRSLYDSGIKLHLTLCGCPLSDEFMSIIEVKKYIESLSCETFVDYIGPVQGEFKSKLLKESHVLILPTSKDLSPICIIEGLAHGCYIISTEVGAIPLLLEGFHSSIVEPTIKAISTSILKYNSTNSKARHKFSNDNQVMSFERYTSTRYQKEIFTIIKGVYHA